MRDRDKGIASLLPMSKTADRKTLTAGHDVGKVIDELPHGAGIDCEWKYEQKGKRDYFTNSLRCMDVNGSDDGYQDFQVVLYKHAEDKHVKLKGPCEGQTQLVHAKGDVDFKIEFTGTRRQKYIDSWSDHLYQTIGYQLGQLGIIKARY